MNDTQFRRHALKLLLAWLALLALMFASLGSAYLSLGVGNPIAALAIALLKSAIVVLLFMGLASAGVTVRIVAATALCTLLLLAALSGVDYATRPDEPAAYQAPGQLEAPASHR
ncbi:caa(3)-type oxidase, subunit IV [Variovorax sp. PBL-H6]|uniref:oxidase n=1 Tax=Variovorax sp. PBL-H6 TaxID=434009 RepID=UPI001318BB76|nr:oxidase [Variovorax sp. PBL-H6]VTU21665.1 caa(3)-type oxidase, subunit IV [Variovorax sp. PBL-H6]